MTDRRFNNPDAISTHALREEGDLLKNYVGFKRVIISTHALREEGDILL